MSAILVSVAEPRSLLAAVSSLVPPLGRAEAQLLVVRRGNDISADELRAIYWGVMLLKAPDDLSERRMRELAASRAGGDILVIRCDVNADDPAWIASLGAVLDRTRREHLAREDDFEESSAEGDALVDDWNALATTARHADSRM